VPKKNLRKILDELDSGDLIEVEWCDASVGKSSGSGTAIDVPVKSWGIYVGLFGSHAKHIVLVQNSFRYSDGLFDLDYTAIPASWTLGLAVVAKSLVSPQVAQILVNSFILGGHRALHKRTFMRKVKNHKRHF
jgi:hypothetical protein